MPRTTSPYLRGRKPRSLPGGVGRKARGAYKSMKGQTHPRKVLSVYERVMRQSRMPYKPLSGRKPYFRSPLFVAYDMLTTPSEIRAFFGAYANAEAPRVAKKYNMSLEQARKELKTYAIYQTGLIGPKTTTLWSKALG